MKKALYTSLALGSVIIVSMGAYQAVGSQNTVCYSVDQSGGVSDLSELCGSEEGFPTVDRTAEAKLLTAEASNLAADGKYSKALELTDRVLAIKPDFAEVYVLRGSLYGINGSLETAIQEIRKGEAIFETRGNSQGAAVMKQFADDLQYSLDSGEWAEQLEEERRIAEEEQ